jgi:hypothetical protein
VDLDDIGDPLQRKVITGVIVPDVLYMAPTSAMSLQGLQLCKGACWRPNRSTIHWAGALRLMPVTSKQHDPAP